MQESFTFAEDLTRCTVAELIEIALQLDAPMYTNLPPLWKQPGVRGLAGLCGFCLLADRLQPMLSQCSEAVQTFVKKIHEIANWAIQELTEKGTKAIIQKRVLELCEYAGGFERHTYSEEKFQPIKEALEHANIECQGQLAYRPSDGLFFLVIDNRFIQITREAHAAGDFPRAVIGHAHITINETMPKVEAEGWWEKLKQQYGVSEHPCFRAKQESIQYLNHMVRFRVIGAYQGVPKSNSRVASTDQLRIESEELEAFAKQGFGSRLNNYYYHITFAEKLRAPYPRLARNFNIASILGPSDLSQALGKLLNQPTNNPLAIEEQTPMVEKPLTIRFLIEQYPKINKLFKKFGINPAISVDAKAWCLSFDLTTVPENFRETLEAFCQSHQIKTEIHLENSKQASAASKTLSDIYKEHYEQLLAQEKTLTLPQRFDALIKLGKIYHTLGQDNLVEKYYEEALTLLEKMGVTGQELAAADLHFRLGKCKFHQNFTKAKMHFEKALEIYQKQYGDVHQGIAKAKMWLANVAYKSGDFDAAIEQHQAAIHMIKTYGDKTTLARHYSHFANAWRQKGDFQQALLWQETALQLAQEACGKYHPLTGWICSNLGMLYEAQEQFELALKYQEKGLRIRQRTLNPTHPALARNYNNLGKAFARNGRYQEALTQFAEAERLVKTYYPDKHDILSASANGAGEAHLQLQQNDQAIAKFTEALNMDSQKNPSSKYVAEDYFRLGQTYSAKGDFAKAIIHYEKSLQIYQNTPAWREDYQRYHCQLALARAYHQQAIYAHKKERTPALELALAKGLPLIQELQILNENILQKEGHDMTLYDLLEYEQIINLYADYQVLSGKAETAAEFYLAQAKNYAQQFPVMAWRWLEKSNTILSSSGQNATLRAESYALRAKIAYSQRRYYEAVKLLQKALALDANPVWTERLASVKQDIQVLLNIVDEDLLMQLQDAEQTYFELESRYLTDLAETKNLSEYAKNRTTEFLIKQRNMLDMAYRRLVEETVLEPNKKYSLALMSKNEIIGNIIEFNCTPKGFQYRLISAKTNKEKKSTIAWSKFSKTFPKETKKILSEQETFLPEILNHLQQQKDIPKPSGNIYYPFAGSTQSLDNKLKENKIVIDDPTKRSLKDTYNREAYEAIWQEQTLYYYKEDNNTTSPGLWRSAWLEKLNAIQNESKHVRLTPQNMDKMIQGKHGNFKKNHVTIEIEYIETRFYGWSFVNGLLALTPALSDSQRIALSRELVKFLKEKRNDAQGEPYVYIDKQIVKHPLIHQLIKKIRCQAPEEEIAQLQTAFINQLKQDIHAAHPEWDKYADMLGHTLLRKALQRNRVVIVPDQKVDARWLIRTSLDKTWYLLETFGRVRLAERQRQQKVEAKTRLYLPARTKSFDMRLSEFDQIKQAYQQHCQQRLVPATPTQLAERYQLLREFAQAYTKTGQWKAAGKLYWQAANDLANDYPWLALRLYQRALVCFQRGKQRDGWKIAEEAATLAKKNHLEFKAQHFLRKACELSEEQPEENQRLQKQLAEWRFSMSWDADIRSQFIHAKQEYFNALYLTFRLYRQPDNLFIQQQLQNALADIIIKLRHLLDQALDRFMHSAFIHDPYYQQYIINIEELHFPCQGSEKRVIKGMIDELAKIPVVKERGGKTPEDKKRFHPLLSDTRYAKLWENILALQPFKAKNRWLQQLFALSNVSKHERLISASTTQLQQQMAQTRLEAFYPMCYSEDRIYDWSFAALLGDNTALSTEIVEKLRHINVLEDKTGEINNNELGKELLGLAAAEKLQTLDNATLEKFQQSFYQKLREKASATLKSLTRAQSDAIVERLLHFALKQQGYFDAKRAEWIPVLETLGYALQEMDGLLNNFFTHITVSPNQQASVQQLETVLQESVALETWAEKDQKKDKWHKSIQQHSFFARSEVFRKNNQPFFDTIEGLTFTGIKLDGNCLFNAIALYLGQDQQFLRNIVAANLEQNWGTYFSYGILREGQTKENLLAEIRTDGEWGGNLEIAILMQLLNRPIAVINPDGTIRNRTELREENGTLRFTGEPIFVAYNGINHYDALILTEGYHGSKILNALLGIVPNMTQRFGS